MLLGTEIVIVETMVPEGWPVMGLTSFPTFSPPFSLPVPAWLTCERLQTPTV